MSIGTLRRDELPRDGLALRVLGQIAGEQQLPVRDWLLFLALTAAQDIAGRLEGAGHLTRAGGRFPGRPPRWVSVDPDWAHMPLVRARGAVECSDLDHRRSKQSGLTGDTDLTSESDIAEDDLPVVKSSRGHASRQEKTWPRARSR